MESMLPIMEDVTKIPRLSWNEDQKTRYLLNSKTRNFLMDIIGKGLQDKYWRPLITTLKESKNLKKLHIEEFLSTLKGKYVALKAQEAFKAEEYCDEAFKEKGYDKDEISFLSRKIQSMLKKRMI
ncbi:hypothetical protein CR513_58725, partial [Mucuna pruriens]